MIISFQRTTHAYCGMILPFNADHSSSSWISLEYGLLRGDRGVIETIAAFDQVNQLLDKACCWSAIDHVVIEVDGHIEVVADLYALVNDAWLPGYAANDNAQRMEGDMHAPSAPASEHANRIELHRAYVLCEQVRALAPEPKEHLLYERRQERHPCRSLHFSTTHGVGLGHADLFMNSAHCLSVRPPDDIGKGKLLTLHVSFNLDIDVHVVKQDELIAPVSISMHALVHSDGVSHARRQKCREGQALSSPRLVLPYQVASPGHINFHQATHNVFVPGHARDSAHNTLHPRERFNLISTVTLFHLQTSISLVPP